MDTNTIFENFKKYAPAFSSIFEDVSKLLEPDKANDKPFSECAEKVCVELLRHVDDPELVTFLSLPVSTNSSDSRIIRKSLLRAIISKALQQAIDPDTGNNCFCMSIRNETLQKQGFNFESSADIDALGKQIKEYIPRLDLSAFGEGPHKDETYFGLYYRYN